MTGWRFILRSLTHHGRIHVTIALGVAAATAVLTGALLVGESVRGSLRRLTLDRLGRIDEVLVTERFFRAALAAELAADTRFQQHFTAAIPCLLLPRVSLEKAGPPPHARASQVTVIGSGPDFWEAGNTAGKPQVLPAAGQIVLNAPLAEDLGAAVGDEVILHLPKANQVPADSPLGRRSDRLRSLAGLKVVAIVPAEGLGRFSLQSSQATPRNAYLALETLQRALDQAEQVNALLVTGSSAATAPGSEADAALAAALQPHLEDYGLRLGRVRRTFPESGGDRVDVVCDYFDLTTSRLLFEPAARQAIEQALAAEHVQPVLTYLATSIDLATEGKTAAASIPYSLITGVDSRPPLGPLATAIDDWVAPLADDELVLNSWAASDLRASPGDRIRVTFFEPETAHGELHERSAEFTLRAIVPLTEPTTPYRRNRPARYEQRPQLANDPQLTPEVQGLTDQDSISNWDAPFPVDYHRVRRQDDVYWQQHRTTPKAFVSLAAGRRLWGSRFGDTTSFRIPVPAGLEPGSAAERQFRRGLESRVLDQLGQRRAALGFSFLPVKARGLAASAGTTPFDVLFLFLSFFVIAAALLLVALLFRLGVERRAEEIGTLLALGLGRRRIGRWFWIEGGCVAALGGVLGIGAGVGYAWLLLAGLRTWWWGAVQTSELWLSDSPWWSLALGYLSGVFVSLLTIVWSVRSLRHIAVRRLLAGEATAESGTMIAVRSTRRARRHAVPLGLVVAAIGLSAAAARWGSEAQAGAFVGAGTLLLAAMLFALRTRLRSWSARVASAASLRLATLAVRNAARNPGRSTATIGLMAVACFLIVAMSAFRQEPTATGTGGFDLIAESAEPIFTNLGRPEARRELLGDDADRLADCTLLGLRVQSGDDASCNNLYRPAQPRVLGVTEAWVRHFEAAGVPGFAWAGSAAMEPAERANPWRLLADTAPGRRAAGRKPAGDTNSRPPLAGDVTSADTPVPVVLDKNTALYSLQLYGGIGEVFEIADADRTIRFRVAGLLSNSILQGSLLIGERDFVRLYPSVSGYRFFLIRVPAEPEPAPSRPPPGYRGGDVAAAQGTQPPRVEQVAAVLEERLSDQGFDAVPAQRRLADLLAVQNTYLSTFQSLGALGLLLGTFGLAAVQARNVLERRRELGLLRAVGFRAARLAGLVMLENVALLVGGLLTGTLATLVALLPQLLGGGAAIPWRDLALMLGAVLVVGVLAGLGTIRTTLRAKVLAALRGD